MRRAALAGGVRFAAAITACASTASAQTAPAPSPPVPPPVVVPVTPPAPTGPPPEAVAHYERGWAYYALGRYRVAAQELERAVRLDPSGYNLYFDLGLVYERMGEVDYAIGAYRRYFAYSAEPAERDRADRIVQRLIGARREIAELRVRPRGNADGWVWFTGVLGLGAIGVGTGLLLAAPGSTSSAATVTLFQASGTASIVAGVGLCATAAVLYVAREARVDRTWVRTPLASWLLGRWEF